MSTNHTDLTHLIVRDLAGPDRHSRPVRLRVLYEYCTSTVRVLVLRCSLSAHSSHLQPTQVSGWASAGFCAVFAHQERRHGTSCEQPAPATYDSQPQVTTIQDTPKPLEKKLCEKQNKSGRETGTLGKSSTGVNVLDDLRSKLYREIPFTDPAPEAYLRRRLSALQLRLTYAPPSFGGLDFHPGAVFRSAGTERGCFRSLGIVASVFLDTGCRPPKATRTDTELDTAYLPT